MIRAGLLFLIFAFAAAVSHAAAPVRIADGDCAALHTALASAGNKNTILLARNGHYPVCDLSLASGTADIDGQGATLQFLTGTVAEGAALTLRNASITSPPQGMSIPGSRRCESFARGGFATEGTALCNNGSLSLEDVSIHDLLFAVACSNGYPVCTFDLLIDSKGDLTLRNLTVAKTSFHDDAFPQGTAWGTGILISNTGVLQIDNSTFAGLDLGASGSAIHSTSMTIANSIFSGTSANFCQLSGSTTSLGGNVATEASCGLDAGKGDRIVADLQFGAFGDHGGLVPTQALTYYSPARAAGVAQNCEAVDARGSTRATGGCDAGAYEYNGGASAITDNGINGSFYDASADGHYVWIERVHDTGDILVTWLTFDRNGHQAWVVGVGALNGNRLHVDMSQNIGGVLQPGGPPTGSTTRPWGSVDIDLSSCLLAQFAYHSTLPEFGSGQFPLNRLTAISDLGCSD